MHRYTEVPVAVTIPEAARRLSVSPMTIRRLIAVGQLHAIRMGRAVRVLTASIEKLTQREGVSRGE